MTVIISILAVVCCVTWVLLDNFYDRFSGDFNFDLDSDINTTEQLDMGELRLLPGESVSYNIVLNSKDDGIYSVALDFNEEVDGGLRQFVNVSATLNGVRIAEGGLSELFEEKRTVEFPAKIPAGETAELTVTYSMPAEIGNEGMNVFSDFYIKIGLKSLDAAEEASNE